jgi:hypothetical protein
MNIQMELRKVCNHPFLLDGVEHRETERQFREYLESGAFTGTTPEQQQYMLNEHGYIMTSGKSTCVCCPFYLARYSFPNLFYCYSGTSRQAFT